MVVVFLLKSTWPPVLSGHNFLVPHPGLPLAPFLLVWYSPDISHSLLESESEESLEQEEESEESSSDVELSLLEPEWSWKKRDSLPPSQAQVGQMPQAP